MSPWKSAISELPPVGQEVLVAVVGEDSRVYAVARVAENGASEAYWESSDDMVHGLSCDDSDDDVYWMAIPPAHSIDGNTSHG